MPLNLKSYFPTALDIDGESIRIRIKRQDPDEAVEFRSRGDRMATKGEEFTDKEHSDFVVDSFARFVTVEPGQIYLDDGAESITAGAAFVTLFAARHDVLSRVIQLIIIENSASAAMKAMFYAPVKPVAPPTAEEPPADGVQADAPPTTH